MEKLEYREVVTEDGRATGRIVEKHARPIQGDYYRHVLIVMKTADSPRPGQGEGQYIVQQRSFKAKHYPGMWDFTGGGVMAGESARAAAIREVQEELSIVIPETELREAFQFTKEWPDGHGLLITVFACRVPVPPNGFRYDPVEVNDVCLMPFSRFLEHVMDHNDETVAAGLREIERTL